MCSPSLIVAVSQSRENGRETDAMNECRQAQTPDDAHASKRLQASCGHLPARWCLLGGLGMTSNSTMRRRPRVQIPVCPELPLVFSRELLVGMRTGFLVVPPLRIASVFFH
jgi:hypothetical protein